eukprot:scaffold128738_cov17-Tisochrysis_lutea.AAC.1
MPQTEIVERTLCGTFKGRNCMSAVLFTAMHLCPGFELQIGRASSDLHLRVLPVAPTTSLSSSSHICPGGKLSSSPPYTCAQQRPRHQKVHRRGGTVEIDFASNRKTLPTMRVVS